MTDHGMSTRTNADPAARDAAPPHEHVPETQHGHSGGWKLALAALGVVYGDIGTSPLYTLKECLHGEHTIAATRANVLGVLSLVLWALTSIVSIKYLLFILKADNEGEGGILALLALVPQDEGKKRAGLLVLMVVFGAALLYGDGVITPAISVLSAMEGLEVATPSLKPAVVPLTVAILLALFVVQKRGTGGIGRVFGPVMLVWFTMIGALGFAQVVREPGVLAACDPRHAVLFLVENRGKGFLILGSVVLAVTGAEALYADMGHFGRGPIRRAWLGLVFPALLLSYLGQGAHILREPEAAGNPFFSIVPQALLYPAVAIATTATVVASQALISGAYSLTHQAVQLGYFPRVTIVHTSAREAGQIYIPEVNSALMISCLLVVIGFGSSTALGAA